MFTIRYTNNGVEFGKIRQSGVSQYSKYKNDVKMELKPHTHIHLQWWTCNLSKVKDNENLYMGNVPIWIFAFAMLKPLPTENIITAFNKLKIIRHSHNNYIDSFSCFCSISRYNCKSFAIYFFQLNVYISATCNSILIHYTKWYMFANCTHSRQKIISE